MDAIRHQSRGFRTCLPVVYVLYVLSALICWGLLYAPIPLFNLDANHTTNFNFVIGWTFNFQITDSLTNILLLTVSMAYNAVKHSDQSDGATILFPIRLVIYKSAVPAILMMLQPGRVLRKATVLAGVERLNSIVRVPTENDTATAFFLEEPLLDEEEREGDEGTLHLDSPEPAGHSAVLPGHDGADLSQADICLSSTRPVLLSDSSPSWLFAACVVGATMFASAMVMALGFAVLHDKDTVTNLVLFSSSFVVSFMGLFGLLRAFGGAGLKSLPARNALEGMVVLGWVLSGVVQFLSNGLHAQHKVLILQSYGLYIMLPYYALFTLSPIYLLVLSWNLTDWDALLLVGVFTF
jgi:hypothetical protein